MKALHLVGSKRYYSGLRSCCQQTGCALDSHPGLKQCIASPQNAESFPAGCTLLLHTVTTAWTQNGQTALNSQEVTGC